MAPISGAPRTCIDWIAWAASARLVSRSGRKRCGSSVWSMMPTPSRRAPARSCGWVCRRLSWARDSEGNGLAATGNLPSGRLKLPRCSAGHGRGAKWMPTAYRLRGRIRQPRAVCRSIRRSSPAGGAMPPPFARRRPARRAWPALWLHAAPDRRPVSSGRRRRAPRWRCSFTAAGGARSIPACSAIWPRG